MLIRPGCPGALGGAVPPTPEPSTSADSTEVTADNSLITVDEV